MQDGYLHYRDICELSVKHLDACAEFHNGSFVVHKTKRLFSSIVLDHAHKQVNAVVKGEGGAVGLTENPPCPEKMDGCWSRACTNG